MKRRWYFTPGWVWRLPLMLGLLIGAALLEGKVSPFATWSMIVVGLFLLVHGWILTYKNIHRINRGVEETEKERIRKLDKEAEAYFGGLSGEG